MRRLSKEWPKHNGEAGRPAPRFRALAPWHLGTYYESVFRYAALFTVRSQFCSMKWSSTRQSCRRRRWPASPRCPHRATSGAAAASARGRRHRPAAGGVAARALAAGAAAHGSFAGPRPPPPAPPRPPAPRAAAAAASSGVGFVGSVLGPAARMPAVAFTPCRCADAKRPG
jgi:hypothetical protein